MVHVGAPNASTQDQRKINTALTEGTRTKVAKATCEAIFVDLSNCCNSLPFETTFLKQHPLSEYWESITQHPVFVNSEGIKTSDGYRRKKLELRPCCQEGSRDLRTCCFDHNTYLIDNPCTLDHAVKLIVSYSPAASKDPEVVDRKLRFQTHTITRVHPV